MKLPVGSREQQMIVMVAASLLLFLWMYFTLLLGPLMRRSGVLGDRVRTVKQELDALERVVGNEARVNQQHEELTRSVAKMRGTLPSEGELPSVMEVLSDLASKSQVKIQTIYPQRTPGERQFAAEATGSDGPAFTTVPIEIDALAGYHELGTFLNLIEGSSSPPVEVASLRLSGNPRDIRRHNMKIVVIGYFSVEKTPLTP